MAMNAGTVAAGGAGSGLAKELYDDLRPKLGDFGSPPGSTAGEQKVADICNSIAQTVVAHIQTNATVAVSVTSVSGVQTGPGVSGPGTGTGTIS